MSSDSRNPAPPDQTLPQSAPSAAPAATMPPGLDDYTAMLNQHLDGWSTAMGVRAVRITRDEVVMEWDVEDRHRQSYGIVHGGVHAGVIETIASIGAALDAMSRGQTVVGLENHTTFLRAVRQGRLRATARPVHRGRRTQVWEGQVTDEQDRLVATGRVRLLCLDPEATLAGSKVELS